MFSQLRLEIAVLAFDNFRDAMSAKYGDPRMRSWDTVKYLDQIEYLMTKDDHATQERLSKERANATIAATMEEIDAVLDARREYNREPEINPDR